MTQASTTEFLLVAAGEDDLEVKFNRLFADTLGERAQLWIALGASHTGAFGLYPDVYEQRVLDFFGSSLK